MSPAATQTPPSRDERLNAITITPARNLIQRRWNIKVPSLQACRRARDKGETAGLLRVRNAPACGVGRDSALSRGSPSARADKDEFVNVGLHVLLADPLPTRRSGRIDDAPKLKCIRSGHKGPLAGLSDLRHKALKSLVRLGPPWAI